MKQPFFIFLVLISGILTAQRDFDAVEITSDKLSDQLYILYGAGGNMGLAIGMDYAYLIDDQFGELTDKITSHIKTLTDKPIKYVLNTHWHGDHVGGNENLGKAGAVIIAHENVRKRMNSRQDRGGGNVVEPAAEAALPFITFNDKLNMYLGNGNTMHAMHVNDAHTDGDTYYYFPESNVLHMGDNFVNGGYPFIDLNSGGNIDGLIKNLNMAMFIVDEETKIIPGHGPLANRKDLQEFLNIVSTIRMRVNKAKSKGHSLEETLVMGLSKEWDATHGQGFINAERLITAIYNSI